MIAGVAVVGGGIAGISTAAALRAGGFTGDITVVDGGGQPYDRPPLSKEFLAGTKTLDDIALQPPGWYDEHKIRLLTGATVTAIRPGTGELELSDAAPVRADRVVLATGGRAARPPIPGLAGPRVHVLRTAPDAERLRAALAREVRVLIVGAGLIGSEVASTATDLGCEVLLVDPVRWPLEQVVGATVAEWLHGRHAGRGVVTIQATVESLRDNDSGVEVALSDGAVHAVDVVVVGVGMAPDTALADAAGLATDRGILVDDAMVTSNPAVLAVGDVARTQRHGVVLPRAEHWDRARQDGQRAAATILGVPPPPETASWFWTDRHGLHVEVVGSVADGDRVAVRGELDRPPFAVFGLADGRVVGAVAVGDSTTARAARRLIDRRVAVAAEQLADPQVDLRHIVRGRP